MQSNYKLVLGRLFITLLIVLAGCIHPANTALDKFSAYFESSNYGSLVNITDIKVDYHPFCQAFVCHNATSKGFFGVVEGSSLIGGNCSILRFPYNSTGLVNFTNNTIKNPEFKVRELGLGGGPTPADFNEGTLYCNNSYTYSEIVLKAEGGNYLFPPSAASTSCFLDKNVIPIYLLYKENPHGNKTYTPSFIGPLINFAKRLNGTGPVIIGTELNPMNTSAVYSKVKLQAKTIKENCPNCLVFLSITLDENYPTSRYYLSKLEKDPELNRTIDGIGFGIDSRFSNKSSVDALFVTEVLPLISDINSHFNKPIMIYYTYLPKTQKFKPLSDPYVPLYVDFFNSAPYLADLGVIGFISQPFYEESSIFPCDDCSLTKNEGDSLKSTPAFNYWFTLCSQYYTRGLHPYDIASYGGADCNSKYSNLHVAYSFENISLDGSLLSPKTLSDKTTRFYKCGTCLFSGSLDDDLEDFKDLATATADMCEKTGEVSAISEAVSVDAVIPRSFAIKSNVDRCYLNCGSGIPIDSLKPYLSKASCPSSCSTDRASSFGIFALANPPSNSFNPFIIKDAAFAFKQYYDRAVSEASDTVDTFSSDLGVDDDPSKKNEYTVVFTIAGLSGISDLWGDYQHLLLISASKDCSSAPTKIKNICCSGESDDSDSGGSSFDDKYKLCSIKDFGDFLKNIHDKPNKMDLLDPNYSDFAVNLANYVYLYDTCQDCYSPKWKEAICDKMKQFTGSTPPECT